ncbi:MAG: PfkB family carbohydrate kinase [bacterium]
MIDYADTVIFGPAYLDTVIKVPGPIVPELPFPLDQSLPVKPIFPDNSLTIRLTSEIGDYLVINLPVNSPDIGGTYNLREAILSRRCGKDCQPIINTIFADACFQQLGGMGAGYAKATGGLLRMPLGDDSLGNRLCDILFSHGIVSKPAILPGHSSDSSLLIQSQTGDKLAVGFRDALINWQPGEDDITMAQGAKYIIFCGVLNSSMIKILNCDITAPVMFAPAMRNIDDVDCPLADLANKIDYLAMNALEWSHLHRREEIINAIPLITITDGARGCDIYLRGKQFFFPALPHPGSVDTNRAGETYAATIWKAIFHYCPSFPNAEISEELLTHIANLARQQAHRQLDIIEFAFPPDDWV